jgi:hypothetical protein
LPVWGVLGSLKLATFLHQFGRIANSNKMQVLRLSLRSAQDDGMGGGTEDGRSISGH